MSPKLCWKAVKDSFCGQVLESEHFAHLANVRFLEQLLVAAEDSSQKGRIHVPDRWKIILSFSTYPLNLFVLPSQHLLILFSPLGFIFPFLFTDVMLAIISTLYAIFIFHFTISQLLNIFADRSSCESFDLTQYSFFKVRKPDCMIGIVYH